jgi:hypothetical protein
LEVIVSLVVLFVFAIAAAVLRLVSTNPNGFLERAQDDGRFAREPRTRPAATVIGSHAAAPAANEQRRVA